ncbi:MAG: site-specific DNA-methyltransferase [Oscillospiraceae bacterium]|nr:site-specific DNA-methyltransferase [Oscillospiraceae bacterium]
MIDLKHGDCLELMRSIPDSSVDMILCDLPYGVTECEWDKVIPFEPLWKQYKRIAKENAAIVLFSSMPFTVDAINSNRKMFRYEWIWQKSNKGGFLNANKMPLKIHENILVFYEKLPTYNPQFTRGKPYARGHSGYSDVYGKEVNVPTISDGRRFPIDVIKCNSVSTSKNELKLGTEKPVDLLEYLIKTYTNEGQTVLDNCMGSGSTGEACVNTNRNFIGYELSKKHYDYAVDRIARALERKNTAANGL